MRKWTLVMMLALLTTIAAAQTTPAPSAAARKAVSMAPLTWRADGAGLYKFDGNISLTNAGISKEGAVRTDSAAGACEAQVSYLADGTITGLAANWTFTGQVTMEVTTTGKASDYKVVTNGVPLDLTKSPAGSSLKWRATLAPQSALTEVRIVYTDSSGVMGSFGNPDLSGFTARKVFYVKGSSKEALYNFQIPVRVGESKKAAAACDIYLDSPSKSDLADIRFTLADGETSLAYYRESIEGAKPDRVVTFWLRIPEIPKDAVLPLYIYYAAAGASSLSDAEKVFDFYEDFNANVIDPKKWKVMLADKTSRAAAAGSMLELDKARAAAIKYKFKDGIIEYRAKIAGSGAVTGIIAASANGGSDLAASSSIIANAAHCIMQAAAVKANDPKIITPGTFYDYRIISDGGDLAFQRYADGTFTGTPQAEVKYEASGRTEMPIGLSAGPGGSGFYCDWIRTRKTAEIVPQVDIGKTSASVEEQTNLPQFGNITLSPDGSLMLAPKAPGGEYISQLVSSPFQARIMAASWPEVDSPVFSVSTNGGAKFYTGWQNGAAKYASKGDFTKGDGLKWRASWTANGPVLKKFSLKFESGTITVIAPGGSEVIKPASKYDIRWDTTGYESSYKMDLSYSLDGGLNFTAIAARAPNTGTYPWAVPQAESGKVVVMVADSLDKTVYGISNAYFAITDNAETVIPPQDASVTTPETTAQKTAEAALSSAGSKKLYELLIVRRKDLKDAKRQAASTDYEDGDIISVKPAGFIWGAEERKNFLIIQAYLTDQQAQALVSAKETTTGTDGEGRQAKKMVKMRRYKVNFNNKELADKGAVAKTGLLSSVILKDLLAITDKGTGE
ncbi:MAG: DUF2341 domain-containing protein [Candidatus Omnitrophota bacterium]